MTRHLNSQHHPGRFAGKVILLALITLVSPARSNPPADPASVLSPSLEALAAALADSMDARCSTGLVRILEVRGDEVKINRGSRGGLRPFSRVALSRADFPAWKAEVASLEEESTWLKPTTASNPGPAIGTEARIRLDIARLALLPPELNDAAAAGMALAWQERLATHAAGNPGFEIIRMPAYPDSLEYRDVARTAGADMAVRTAIQVGADGWRVAIHLGRVRKFEPLEPIFGHAPTTAPAADEATSLGEWDMIVPPPGLQNGLLSVAIRGPVLDIMSRRWLWSDVQVILDDRIQAWTVGPDGLSPGSVVDLASIWPAVVPTRWPVAEILPVNTYYDMTGEEARVNYALCSNQRPRYLTINIEKIVPDSLNVVESDGPLDHLPASLGGCFRELDRVATTAGFATDPAMPKSAIAKLSLEEVLRDGSGQLLRTQGGQLRKKKVAVIYYDEATASVWLSSPESAMRLPETFGGEMDDYRAGLAGPPGFLVTGDAVPGEADHLEWWVLTGGRCERRWVGPVIGGSITAILTGDRNLDERDDLVLAVVQPDGDGYRSHLQMYSSRPRGGLAP